MRLSPLWQRRFAIFRAHRRGWISLILFAVIFVVSMGANFIANDKPFLLEYRGHLYFPALQQIPEQVFEIGRAHV